MNRVIVRPSEQTDQYDWRTINDQNSWEEHAGTGSLEQMATEIKGKNLSLWVLLPGAQAVCQIMQFSAKERKHLSQITPFQFEDSIAADIDDMHFALGEPEGESVMVTYLSRQILENLINTFNRNGLDIHGIIPEPLLLPGDQTHWSICYGQQVSVKYGEQLGFAIEPGLTAPALDSLLSQENVPEKITLLADTEEHLTDLQALIPSELDITVESRLTSIWDSLDISHMSIINLRQGEFARRLPIERWWKEWRYVAAVIAAAVVVYGGVNFGIYQSLKSEHLVLRQQIEKTYRSVVPRGRISDPEKQLKAKLAGFSNPQDKQSVMELFGKVGPLIAASEDVSLQGINYSSQRGELRLNIVGKTFNAIEQLRANVVSEGLQAELLNASAQGDAHQARLRIKPAS